MIKSISFCHKWCMHLTKTCSIWTKAAKRQNQATKPTAYISTGGSGMVENNLFSVNIYSWWEWEIWHFLIMCIRHIGEFWFRFVYVVTEVYNIQQSIMYLYSESRNTCIHESRCFYSRVFVIYLSFNLYIYVCPLYKTTYSK